MTKLADDHGIPREMGKANPSLVPSIEASANRSYIPGAANSVDKMPLDRELTARFNSLVDSLVEHQGLTREDAIAKAQLAMKEELQAHTNSVPARPMDPAELEKLKRKN